MPPPLDPQTEAAIQRLLEVLNNLAAVQTEEQRLASGLIGLGQGIDPSFIDIPEVREYDRSDAIQLLNEVSRGVFLTSRRQGRILTDAQEDEVVQHILTTLHDRLLPGVGAAERIRPIAGADPITPHIALANSAIITTSVNIQRFPNNALLGMLQGAVATALFQNGRISPSVFAAYMAGGAALTDLDAREVTALHNSLRDNMPQILNAATSEAVGADFGRAVSTVIAGESTDGEVVSPSESLFPVFPGFGTPSLRAFTQDEAQDLEENFKKLLDTILPTGNQLETDAERSARRLFIDDLVDEAHELGTGDSAHQAQQAILDGAAARFDIVRETAVIDAAVVKTAKDLAARFNTNTKIRDELKAVLPTDNQLETDEEKAALKKFIDDQVDRANAAAADAERQGLGDEAILQSKVVVVEGATGRFEIARTTAVLQAQANLSRKEAVTAFQKRTEAAPTTVPQKNAILSEAFQTPATQTLVGGEFEELTDEVKALARSEISGMSEAEARSFALGNAARWTRLSNVQRQQEGAEEARVTTTSLTEANRVFNTIAARAGLSQDETTQVRPEFTQEIAAALELGEIPAELEEFISGQLRVRLENIKATAAARERFVTAGGQEELFDEFALGGLPEGFGITPVGGLAPLPTGRGLAGEGLGVIPGVDPAEPGQEIAIQPVQQLGQEFEDILADLRIQRDPSAFPVLPRLDPFGNVIPVGPPSQIERPIPIISPELVTPELRQAAGTNVGFLNFLTSQIGTLQQQFQTVSRPRVDPDIFRSTFGGTFSSTGKSLRDLFPDVPLETLTGFARRTATIQPPTFPEFFQRELPVLREQFRLSPSGLREELSERQEVEREAITVEREAITAEREAETQRRRRLQLGGRTIVRR